MGPIIECEQLSVQFSKDSLPVLDNVNLQIKKGQFVSIIGKSGSGKTTLLQIIGGLLKPTAGTIKILGKKITQPRDEVTYVFQKPILLEWKNVLENVLLPIELKRKPTSMDRKKAIEVLAEVGLSGHEEKYPHELSGGMMSRVSLARAFLTEPEILLMDEPFSALDAMTKEQLHHVLLRLQNRFSSTILFITHDIQEAVYLSDYIILLGNEPAQVVNLFHVPIMRPRLQNVKFEQEFTKIVRDIYEQIEGLSGRLG